MREIIAVINEKGGVSKTTTAAALSSGLRKNGLRVLSVDLDTQGNLTHVMGAAEGGPTILDVMMDKVSVMDAIQHIEQGDIIIASPSLARTETLITGEHKEERLKQVLEPARSAYDVIVLDLPPGLSLVTIMALTATSSAIIPVIADILSVKGLAQLYQIVEAIRQKSNPSLKLMGILLTRYNSRSVLRRDMATVIRDTAKKINTKVFKATIREAIAVGEAQAQQQDLFSYSPKSKVAEDYKAFVAEVINDIQPRKTRKKA